MAKLPWYMKNSKVVKTDEGLVLQFQVRRIWIWFLFICMLFSCVKKDIPPEEEEKTKVDSTKTKCGCPDDYNIT